MAQGIPAIIPARSGSTLKDKNIRPLLRRPLMAWAIKAAKQSRMVDRVIVSTDSEKYAEIARKYGAEVPFLRPAPLAEDVPTEDVIIHAVNELDVRGHYYTRIAVTIQCTTPLLTPSDIDACVAKCMRDDADSAMTVTEVTEFPHWMFTINRDELLFPFLDVPLKGDWGVRQTLPKLYRPNGAVYATRKDALVTKRRIIGDHCYPVFMPRWRSLDIDTEEDFELVEAVLRRGLHRR